MMMYFCKALIACFTCPLLNRCCSIACDSLDVCCLTCLNSCHLRSLCGCCLHLYGMTCCNFVNCECNCCIFPAPASSYQVNQRSYSVKDLQVEFLSLSRENEESIPYLLVSTKQSRKADRCIVYFHGNAEDSQQAALFMLPIAEQNNIKVYIMEYPTYGTYTEPLPWRISDKIKANALRFYDSLSERHVYIMGRSIGSGGATFLANRRRTPLLILVSPFDTIKNVALSHVGCIGGVVKNHFNNMEEIATFNGSLLIVHGKVDEVIPYEHGLNLYKQFQLIHPHAYSRLVAPENMSHNRFNFQEDIGKPVRQVLQTMH